MLKITQDFKTVSVSFVIQNLKITVDFESEKVLIVSAVTMASNGGDCVNMCILWSEFLPDVFSLF